MEATGQKEQTILIVDDVPENIDVLKRLLIGNYKIKVALNGPDALKVAGSSHPPDLILLDIIMPGMDGIEVCRKIKAEPGTAKIPVIFVTAKDQSMDEALGFKAGAVDYISKPISPPVVLARIKTHLALYDQNRVLEEKVSERTQQLQEALAKVKTASLDTILRLTNAAEYKDEDTGAHIQRMSNYCAAIARQMGVNPNSVDWLLYAAPMHDIGKIGIPDRILLKPDKLDPEEWEIMKLHTVIGGKILHGSKAGFIRLGEVIALTHHEKWDGSGYPHGLKGKKIPLVGRITALADVFDALTTQRPYKKPFSIEKSFRIIQEGRGSHFDPEVVDAFFNIEKEILTIKETYSDTGESLLFKMIGGRPLI